MYVFFINITIFFFSDFLLILDYRQGATNNTSKGVRRDGMCVLGRQCNVLHTLSRVGKKGVRKDNDNFYIDRIVLNFERLSTRTTKQLYVRCLRQFPTFESVL